MTIDEMLLKAARRWVREHPDEAERLRLDYSTFANGFLADAEAAFNGAIITEPVRSRT